MFQARCFLLFCLLGYSFVVGDGEVLAQNFPVTPANPTEFKKRDLGGSLGSSVVGVGEAKAQTKTKTLRYIAVSDNRSFESTDGKKITARLIAFEEGDVATVKRPLTLIKDGRIRLLVRGKQKASVVPLTRLREEDQDYVKAVDEANRAAAAATPSAGTGSGAGKAAASGKGAKATKGATDDGGD